jgi:fatty acid desaturase
MIQDTQPIFSKNEYLALRRSFSFEPNTLLTLTMLGVSLALFALGAVLVQDGGFVPYVVSQFVFSIAFFQGFALLHECSHGNATSRKWLDVAVGHVASVFCFLPFYPWRYIHLEHHKWNGNLENDPAFAAIRRWHDNGHVPLLASLSWRSWIPLVALIQHVVFWTYPIKLVSSSDTKRSKLIGCAISVGLLAVTYTVLFIAFP